MTNALAAASATAAPLTSSPLYVEDFPRTGKSYRWVVAADCTMKEVRSGAAKTTAAPD
jgi:hypothetical protein